MPTKITGSVHPSKGGQLKFVGRIIKRLPREPKLFISVEPRIWTVHFRIIRLGAIGELKQLVLQCRTFERLWSSLGESPLLSHEAHAKYRRALGKLAWLLQTRDDIHIMVCILSTGQAAPNERHERALRQVLRWAVS